MWEGLHLLISLHHLRSTLVVGLVGVVSLGRIDFHASLAAPHIDVVVGGSISPRRHVFAYSLAMVFKSMCKRPWNR